MPHRCVRCNTMYDDTANEILKGCPCGARLFFYVKKKHLEESEKLVANMSDDQKKQIESDVFDIIDAAPEDDKPVILEFESINVLSPGKYEIDLVHLFKKDPVIFKVGEGKYVIDIQE